MNCGDRVWGSLPVTFWLLWASVSPAANLSCMSSLSDSEGLLAPAAGMSSRKQRAHVGPSTHAHLCARSPQLHLPSPVPRGPHPTPPWAGLMDSTTTLISNVSSFPHPCCHPQVRATILSFLSWTRWQPPEGFLGSPPTLNSFCSLRTFSDVLSAPACLRAKLLQSCLTLCNLWTVAGQAPLSMGFSRQEPWSGLPCPPPGDLPNPGTQPASPALAEGFFTASATWDQPKIF